MDMRLEISQKLDQMYRDKCTEVERLKARVAELELENSALRARLASPTDRRDVAGKRWPMDY